MADLQAVVPILATLRTELGAFKACAASRKLFLGVGAAAADANGCSVEALAPQAAMDSNQATTYVDHHWFTFCLC